MAIFNEAYIEEYTRLEKESRNEKLEGRYKEHYANMDTKKLKNEYRLYRNDAKMNRESSKANSDNSTLSNSKRSVEDKAYADRHGHVAGLAGKELAKRGVNVKELNDKIDSIGKKATSTNEAAEWHGKYFLSKEELHDPKFRSSQFKKVHAIIRNCLKSESFNKEFTAVPCMYDYFEDDDSNDVLKRWTYESKKSRVLSMCYFPDKLSREDGTAKDSADFIMKAFEKAKKEDPKNTFGKLKYDEDHGQIDYKL